jgi:hypothetical protein
MNILDVFNGKIGNVVDSGEEYEMVNVVGEINCMEDSFYRNDVMLEIEWESGVPIEEFECDPKNVYLVDSEDGYRGDGCYFGVALKDGNLYWLDVVGEGMVYEVLN